MIILTSIDGKEVSLHAKDIAVLIEREGLTEYSNGLTVKFTEVVLYPTTGKEGYNVKETIREIHRLSSLGLCNED